MAERKLDAAARRCTIYDVAKEAGVSPATVSHAVNGTAAVSQKTLKRVEDAIRKLDYMPNANARALRQTNSRLIGVILRDISSEYYAQCVSSILQCAQEENYVVLTGDTHFRPDIEEKIVAALVERRVDGLMFVAGNQVEKSIRMAREAGIPLVLGDRYLEGFPCVQFNNFETMRAIVHACYDAGYRRFGYMGEVLQNQQNLEKRYGGFAQGLIECGIPAEDRYICLTPRLNNGKMQPAYEQFSAYIRDTPADKRPQIMLTSNDMIAQGIISAILRSGLRVPEDLAVFGFDNISIAVYCTPSISSVEQDPYKLGEECFRMLMRCIRREETENVMLTQNVALRSSAPLPRANGVLFREEGGIWAPDPFCDEQNLLLRAEGKAVLVTGCAHRGIVNIVRRARELAGGRIDAVVGGFHLSNPRTGVCEPEETLREVFRCFGELEGARFYTGHCTGDAALARLQAALPGRVAPLHAGLRLEL